jgi:hypothetical protein
MCELVYGVAAGEVTKTHTGVVGEPLRFDVATSIRPHDPYWECEEEPGVWVPIPYLGMIVGLRVAPGETLRRMDKAQRVEHRQQLLAARR